MGLFSNISRWFNNSPNQDALDDANVAFEDAKEEWKAENGTKGIGPYTQARHDWRSRIGQCPGSGTPANFIQIIKASNPKVRKGMCPVCRKDKLSVTKAGKTWPHKTPAKSTPA